MRKRAPDDDECRLTRREAAASCCLPAANGWPNARATAHISRILVPGSATFDRTRAEPKRPTNAWKMFNNVADSLKSHPLAKTFSECLAQINGLSSSGELRQDECEHVTTSADGKPQTNESLHEAAMAMRESHQCLSEAHLRSSDAGQSEAGHLQRIQDNARAVEGDLKRYFDDLREKLDDVERKALDEVAVFRAKKCAELESANEMMARRREAFARERNNSDSANEAALEATESSATAVNLFHQEFLRFVPSNDIAEQFEIFDHKRLMAIDAPDRLEHGRSDLSHP